MTEKSDPARFRNSPLNHRPYFIAKQDCAPMLRTDSVGCVLARIRIRRSALTTLRLADRFWGSFATSQGTLVFLLHMLKRCSRLRHFTNLVLCAVPSVSLRVV